MFRLLVILLFLWANSVAFSQAEKKAVIIWESFEKECDWQNVGWQNTVRANLSLSSRYSSHKNKSLKIKFRNKKLEGINKIGIYKNTNLDLSNANLSLDVYNQSFYKLRVAVGFNTGKDFVYFESMTKALKRGWNKNITFNLDGYNFKSKQTEWNYLSALENRDDIKRIIILIYFPQDLQEASLYLDNIRLEEK